MNLVPDTLGFQKLLASLNVTIGEGEIEVCSETQSVSASRELIKVPALFLNSNQNENCRISALTSRLCKVWQSTEHPVTQRLAELTLAVFSVLKAGYPDAFTLFNTLSEHIVPVDVSHFAIFLSKAQTGIPAEFSGFRFGSLQTLSLKHRSKRANSDFYELNKERLCHRNSMESPIFKLAVMSFIDLYYQAPSRRAISDELFPQVLLCYYEELSKCYVERMWQYLDDQQSIGVAAGIEAFNAPSLRQSPGLSIVTVYLNQSSHPWDGYLVPMEAGIYSNTWIGKPAILRKLEDYQSGLKFPVSPTLAQVAKYGVRARRSANQSEFAEALLNFTIALEMLFSEKNNTSQAISRRLAALISQPNPTSYKSSKKKILDLYDARSKYVHAGIHPIQDAVDDMTKIFEKTLASLVYLEHHQVLRNPESISKWIRKLDWIATGYEAEQIPSCEIQIEVGLLQARESN